MSRCASVRSPGGQACISMVAGARTALLVLGAIATLAAADSGACGSDDAGCAADAAELMPVELLQSELHVGRGVLAGHGHGHEAQRPAAAHHVAAAPMPPSADHPTWRRRRQTRREAPGARAAAPRGAGPAGRGGCRGGGRWRRHPRRGGLGFGNDVDDVQPHRRDGECGRRPHGLLGQFDFIETSLMYIILIGIIFVGFSIARRRYPLVYSKNVTKGFALGGSLPVPPNSFSGWVSTSYYVDLDKVSDSVGLDQAMLLRFCDLGMNIMKWIGVPMICIGGTCNLLFGGNAADGDNMSLLSFGNVEYGSWLYYPYSVVVWMVCVLVHKKICAAQADFLHLRFKWLREMDRVRANTILVDGIPEQYQRDDLLYDFFDRMFPGQSILDAHCVKDSGDLLTHWNRRIELRRLLREAEAIWELSGKDPEKRPQHSTSSVSIYGTKVDSIDSYQKELVEIEGQIKAEREKLEEDSKTVGGVNLSTGFVTFAERSCAEVALAVNVDEDLSDWIIENPPSPADILWVDLKQDPNARFGRELTGFMLVVGLYMAYLPIVVVITNLAELVDMGSLDTLWSVVAPTMGLQVMVAFLPTFLMIIFENFFTLKAGAWAQHKVQTWYFWFNVVFVIMIAAVGTDFFEFADALLTSPFSVFSLLGDTLPYATHYYCNYIVLQWFVHFMNLTRYVQYSKFKGFSALYSEEEAAKMCEPEDQHYYGIGSRSARFTTMMCIGLVYGTMSPPINLLTWVNFFVCRVVYGYTMVFAETKKTDLGGVFWATQLAHIYVGLMIYVVCMTGVFYCRVSPETDGDETVGSITAPVVISALAIPYVIWARRKFLETTQPTTGSACHSARCSRSRTRPRRRGTSAGTTCSQSVSQMTWRARTCSVPWAWRPRRPLSCPGCRAPRPPRRPSAVRCCRAAAARRARCSGGAPPAPGDARARGRAAPGACEELFFQGNDPQISGPGGAAKLAMASLTFVFGLWAPLPAPEEPSNNYIRRERRFLPPWRGLIISVPISSLVFRTWVPQVDIPTSVRRPPPAFLPMSVATRGSVRGLRVFESCLSLSGLLASVPRRLVKLQARALSLGGGQDVDDYLPHGCQGVDRYRACTAARPGCDCSCRCPCLDLPGRVGALGRVSAARRRLAGRGGPPC
ncbi:unnamed protein product [Prorocentrum cordatum]|uniref:CSC1/OSCA1-like 7TM region domain-containing protein n=1 Tax=Prorocentrum cordatum TaxID=2364126 RepID=A0ABN9UN95_9DINO|nr:unnamed protein product [Polarella glacialis]